MRILWITNCFFKEYQEAKGLKVTFTGGWMRSLALKLKDICSDIEIAVASREPSVKKLEELRAGGFIFYALPGSVYSDKYDKSIESDWIEINRRFNPDIVHIHGSEFPHGLAYVRACGNKNVLVSLQGIVSRYARYNSGGITNYDFTRNITPFDLFISSTPFADTKKYENLGKLEEELLKSVSHIVGRTDWDKVHTWTINPEAQYHFCNETLREEFYSLPKWSPALCNRHTIFLSQAARPVKAIQKVIEALPLILRKYPDTLVFVAGNDFTCRGDLKTKLKRSTYANYILHLMKEKGVTDKISFLGMLDAPHMAEQYRKANVFICPSSIENSPNSVGESQLIGCPVVASYVGGTPDMVDHGKTGLLYRFEEIEMLAYYVCKIFENDDYAQELSNNGIEAASVRHDGNVNATRMLEIYNGIFSE